MTGCRWQWRAGRRDWQTVAGGCCSGGAAVQVQEDTDRASLKVFRAQEEETQGPGLALMLCCHGLKILHSCVVVVVFNQKPFCFHFALGLTNSLAGLAGRGEKRSGGRDQKANVQIPVCAVENSVLCNGV